MTTSATANTDATLLFQRRYTTEGVDPFDQVEWEIRDALIPGREGEDPVFEQKHVEFPAFWSQNATNICAQKYFAGAMGTPEREWSVKQLIGRVVGKITLEGEAAGYFASAEERDTFRAELTYILLHQMASFNSPVWFNIGVTGVDQVCSACFILSVDDELEDILEWYREEGLIFRNGSGAGVNLSRLRGSMESLSRGGKSSGPVTFMRGADASAGTITSGGRTRRAAKMVILDVDHPDIEEFIWCKANEEKKARALAAAGFDMSLNTAEGTANWASLQYQNANNSVRVTDAFMKAVEDDDDWHLVSRKGGEPVKTMKARDLMHQISDAAWQCADPGIQYEDIIQDWHTTPRRGRISASNPCSEYMHIDNSSCNLASLNLLKFLEPDGSFNVDAFLHVTEVIFAAQEILIAFAEYPTERIGANTRALRQIGIGYANLGALLMASGLPYDSEDGRHMAAAITAMLTGTAYATSARIAERVGPFDDYALDAEDMMRVLRKHRDAAKALQPAAGHAPLTKAAQRVWGEALSLAKVHGVRNAQASVLAPTGTIAFMMDCDTTGIEPDFSLLKFKKLAGGGTMTIVNQTIPRALAKLGYGPDEISQITEHIMAEGDVVHAPHLSEEHKEVFDCAIGRKAIGPLGHVRMMAAVQPFLSGAISKTVNLPAESTIEDITDVYMEGWRLGLKAVAIYRDGTKVAQPLDAAKDKDEVSDDDAPLHAFLRGQRQRVPDDAETMRRRFMVGGTTGYIHVGLMEDGQPGDLFVQISKAGSQLRAWTDVFCVMASLALQYGMPVEEFVDKFAYVSFDPAGFTNDPQIPTARSVVDYLARWMAKEFLDPATQAQLGIGATVVPASDEGESDGAPAPRRGRVDSTRKEIKQSDGTGSCARCGGQLVWTGKCQTCVSCGETGGCG